MTTEQQHHHPQKQRESSPFDSANSPYPLLTAWYYNRLFHSWREMTQHLVTAYATSPLSASHLRYPASHPRYGEIAAARLAVSLSWEYERLEQETRLRARAVGPDGSDPLIDFYDEIQAHLDEKHLKTYREVLQDLSGSRILMLDEEEQRERMLRGTRGEEKNT